MCKYDKIHRWRSCSIAVNIDPKTNKKIVSKKISEKNKKENKKEDKNKEQNIDQLFKSFSMFK